MPLLKLYTSAAVPKDERDELLYRLSTAVAQGLSKPESFMMVVLDDNLPMLMGGVAATAALLEVRSVGAISPAQASSLTARLTQLVSQALQLPPDRVYCTFEGVAGAMWGHNGNTFG